MAVSELERIRGATDEELEQFAANLRRRAELQSALMMADLSVARFEPPSDAVDRQLDRNLLTSSKISSLQKMIREEQERRAV